MHVCWWWEEAGVPAENLHRCRENMQTPHRNSLGESIPKPSCCGARVLTTALLCHPHGLYTDEFLLEQMNMGPLGSWKRSLWIKQTWWSTVFFSDVLVDFFRYSHDAFARGHRSISTATPIGLSHRHGSGYILKTENVGAFWRTSLHSHQFKWNHSGKTQLHASDPQSNPVGGGNAQ